MGRFSWCCVGKNRWRILANVIGVARGDVDRRVDGVTASIDITPDYGLCAKRSSEILNWVD